MIPIDLLFNLSFLVALTILSGFIDKRFPRNSLTGVLLQGMLFGTASVLGMLRPLEVGDGVFFDGQSVMLSLCALFFGPIAAAVSVVMAALFRISLGGPGALTGALVIFSSAGIGLWLRRWYHTDKKIPSIEQLYILGLCVHLVMIGLMFTLPTGHGMTVIMQIGIALILLYPLATLFAGKILTDQMAASSYLDELHLKALVLDQIRDHVTVTDLEGTITYVNQAQVETLGYSRENLVGSSTDIYGEDPSQGATQETVLMETIERGQWRGDIVNYGIDGSEYLMDCRTTIVRDRFGRPIALCGVSTDITDRHETETELRESEARYRHLFETMSQGVVYHNASGRIIGANPAATRLLGLSMNEMLSRTSMDPRWRMINEAGEPLPGKMHPSITALKRGRPVLHEVIGIYNPASDEHHWLSVNAIPQFKAGQKKPYQVYTTLEDITEQKRAEAAILKRLENQSIISRIASATVAVQPLDVFHETCVTALGEALRVSRAYLFHFDAATNTMTNTHEWCAQDTSPQKHLLQHLSEEAFSWWTTQLRTGAPIRYADIEEIPDESVKALLREQGILSILAVPLFAENDFYGFIGFDDCLNHRRWNEEEVELLVSISKIIAAAYVRANAEEALRDSEALFRNLFDNHTAVKLLIDKKTGAIRDANRAAEQFYGWSKEEIRKKTMHDINTFTEEEIQQEMHKARTLKRTFYEFKHKCADGAIRDVAVFDSDVVSKGEHLVHAIVHDITERKQVEDEREKLQARFNQAQKMESVGRLAGGVAHDFNNMLNVILGYTELALEQVEQEDPIYAGLIEIQKAAERSAELTRQLLAFARKQTVAPRVLNINDTVSGMLKMLHRLIGEDIDLVWKPGTELHLVKIDPSQMDQILANLCVNARDAIDGVGTVTIETRNVCLDEEYCSQNPGIAPDDYILLTVSDTGCGMDKETLAHLFEPFFTTKGIGQGTGLGLATVYGVVTQNRGFMTVYSEVGRGTTFRIYLPRYINVGDAPEVKQKPLSIAAGNETVLLVEDESAILTMTQVLLQRLGYTVLTAATPTEALRITENYEETIDLLLTDVVMPEMNGRDLAVKLAAARPSLKLLFMSGYTADVIAHHGILEEGVHFIQKPFTIRELAMKLREALGEDVAE